MDNVRRRKVFTTAMMARFKLSRPLSGSSSWLVLALYASSKDKAIRSGEKWSDIGHLMCLGYAYHCLECPSLDGYRNAPAFPTWAFAFVKPEPYDRMAFVNLLTS